MIDEFAPPSPLIANIWGLDLNPFDEGGIFGSGDAEQAKKRDKQAIEAWQQLRQQIPDTPYIDPNEMAFFDQGPELQAPTIGYSSPEERAAAAAGAEPFVNAPDLQDPRMVSALPGGAAGMSDFYGGPQLEQGAFQRPGVEGTGPGPSAYEGLSSAFGEMGPSAFEGYSSAFEDIGPSSYSDLAFNAGDLEGMRGAAGYFGDLVSSGGRDAVSEADYARRRADAEMQRRAHSDAALAELEMRGQGGVGNQLLSELSGNQAMTSDMYLAGLDAAAQAQQRRDQAAQTQAGLLERAGRAQLDADALRAQGLDDRQIAQAMGLDSAEEARAAGLDMYATEQAGGMDRFATDQAAGLDTYSNADWDRWMQAQEGNVGREFEASQQNVNRANTAQDANVGLYNENLGWNVVGAPQQRFGNQLSVTSGEAGQTAASAQGLREGAVYPFQDVILPTVSATTQAVGATSGKKK